MRSTDSEELLEKHTTSSTKSTVIQQVSKRPDHLLIFTVSKNAVTNSDFIAPNERVVT
jgi:hypothetical protein